MFLMFVMFLNSPIDELIVIVTALAYTLASVAIQRKLSNPVRLQEIQIQINKISKELNEMIKNNAPKEAITEKQKEIMPLMGESMKAQFKPMVIILPLFFIVYYALVPLIPIGVKSISLQESFFVAVLIIGFITSIALMIKDRAKAKKKMNEKSTN